MVGARGQPRAIGSGWFHIEVGRGKLVVGVDGVGGSAFVVVLEERVIEVGAECGVRAVCG